MNIKKSLAFRTRHWVQKNDRKDVIFRNGLTETAVQGVSQSMLESMETVQNYVKNANVLLDIGAHHGLFSKAANALFRLEKTICFEPHAGHNETIQRNNAGSNLHIENVALSDSEGEVTFFLHEDETMNSIVEADGDVLNREFPFDDPAKMKSTTVPTNTLDTLIGKMQMQQPVFLLKIDTQGNELNVLKHGIETLRKTEVCFIEYMFLSPYKQLFTFHDLVSFMDQQGFDCHGALSISKRPSKKVSAVDFLFVNRNI